MTPKLLTPKELSDWIKIPEATLATQRARPGRDPIPFIKIGNHVRYPEKEVTKWLERNTFYDTKESKDHGADEVQIRKRAR
jgi:hypothetical protein